MMNSQNLKSKLRLTLRHQMMKKVAGSLAGSEISHDLLNNRYIYWPTRDSRLIYFRQQSDKIPPAVVLRM
jgi:hypothetical protein